MRESKRPGDRDAYEQRLRYELKFLNYAPIVFISAQSGKGTEKIFPLLEEVATERRKRVSTSQMNRFIEKVDFERASVPMKSRVKILYMTQASVAPPIFVLFTNRAVKLHFSYQRFLENQIRKPSASSAPRSGSRTGQEIRSELEIPVQERFMWGQSPKPALSEVEGAVRPGAARFLLRKSSQSKREGHDFSRAVRLEKNSGFSL